MSKYGVPYKEVEKECDEDLFIEVSQHIDDYIKVGEGLHLTSKDLDTISQTENDDVKRKITILWDWKSINGSTATAINLIKAFLEMSDLYVAEAILKYLSKRATSSPQVNMCCLAPEKAKVRYSNWEELTEEDQETVRNQLMDDNRGVRKAYASFVAQIIKSFKERDVDPRTIQSIIQSYSVSESKDRPVEMFDFRKDDSITDVVSEFSKHCTWFNYDLFQLLVEIVGNEQEKQYLKTYQDHHLIPYLKRSIFEIPFAPSHSQSQRTELLLKVSKDLVITGGEVKSIQRNLAKLLGFESASVLHFHNYNEGCIELVFSLPTVVVNECFSKSTLSRYFVWDPSRNSFKVDVDVVTLL